MQDKLGPRIAVIGAGQCSAEEAETAEQVGRLLAEASAAVLTGGRGGVMEAASRGARLAGGLVVGVLPGDDVSQANPWVSLPIVTGLGEARNAVLIRTAEAVIAIGGEYGALSEIAFALKFGRPVIGINTWRAASRDQQPLPIHEVQDAAAAVTLALSLLARKQGDR